MKMKIMYLHYFFISLALVSFQCDKNKSITAPEDSPINLSGVVVDNKGNPINGANIHFLFSLTDSSFGKIEKSTASTRIQFSIPSRSFVKLQTLRWHTREIVETIVEDTLLAGNYSYSISSKKYTNGLYFISLNAGSFSQEKYLLISNADVDSLITTIPLCSSNSFGQFSVSYQMFGFGSPIIQTSEKDGTIIGVGYISHSIKIVIAKSGYKTLVQPILIDTTKSIQQTFQFE
ncbi:MAG: hypothetical protein Q8L88_10575 [Bacteroidota bacterium]|nr:hypothetical protein [Bacteroidota bacterium]